MKSSASPARETAIKILRQVENRDAYANHLLEIEYSRSNLTAPDRRLAFLLVYGVLRSRNRLDWVISQYSDYPVENLTSWIRNGLRIGAYQLLDMPDLRPSVAVDESVCLAYKYGHKGTAALVNAILRKVASCGQGNLPTLEKDPEDHLVIAQSHPRWLVKRWLKRYGHEISASICRINNIPPPLTIRWNSLKEEELGKIQEVLHDTLENAIQSEAMPEGIIAEGPRPIIEQAIYREGWIDIQGISSMLISRLLGPEPGEKVLDACAGRGGKSCHMAELMGNRGRIVCVDHNRGKLEALCKRAERLDVKICSAVCGRSDDEIPLKGEIFDRILVDAPCSSLGIIRRHPEIRWIRKEEDLQSLAGIQKRILANAANDLRDGGSLLYCTCSLEPEETDDVMEDFMKRFPHFKVADIRRNVPFMWQDMIGSDGALRLMPFLKEADGFFAFSVTKYK
ncbi:16S rRNA (cytosine(967)-C(5))-methyltransferase RsmB [bacterium]|nr:16S rRNA (cytosine(967)-C(5))-methyltransferase RsmB [bacterium]